MYSCSNRRYGAFRLTDRFKRLQEIQPFFAAILNYTARVSLEVGDLLTGAFERLLSLHIAVKYTVYSRLVCDNQCHQELLG